MINTLGNVECFELCDISPKIQCLCCLKHWTEEIVYCTSGTCLVPTKFTRKKKRKRFDALTIPNFVIKKGGSHGARHGKSEQREYHQAKQCLSKARKKNRFNFSMLSTMWNLHIFTDEKRLGWGPLQTFWQSCTRRPFIHRYLGRKTKVRKGLEIVLRNSRTSRANAVKTRLSRSSTKVSWNHTRSWRSWLRHQPCNSSSLTSSTKTRTTVPVLGEAWCVDSWPRHWLGMEVLFGIVLFNCLVEVTFSNPLVVINRLEGVLSTVGCFEGFRSLAIAIPL